MIDTDCYYMSPSGWRHAPSGLPVVDEDYIAALDKWRDETFLMPDQPKAVAVDKPKRKWEVAFENGSHQHVTAHSFILSDTDIAFHVDGQLPAVFWAQTRNIQHVREIA